MGDPPEFNKYNNLRGKYLRDLNCRLYCDRFLEITNCLNVGKNQKTTLVVGMIYRLQRYLEMVFFMHTGGNNCVLFL